MIVADKVETNWSNRGVVSMVSEGGKEGVRTLIAGFDIYLVEGDKFRGKVL
jgi:hypothetical protein